MGRTFSIAATVAVTLCFAGVAVWLALAPGSPAAPSQPMIAPAGTAEALLEASRAAVRADEPERARAMLEAGVAQHPGDTDLRLALAELLVRTGDHAGAADQYAEVIAFGATDAGTLYAAGMVARLAGQPERAVEWLAEASRREPASPIYAVHLGQARLSLGDAAGAKADLLRAATLDEGLAIAWGTLGEIHLRENNAEIARDMARRARELEPTVTAWRVIEARASNRLGDADTALILLGGVGPESATNDGVLRTKGEAFGLLGRPGDAARMYAEAGRPYDAAVWFERAGEIESAITAARRAASAGDERGAGLVARLTAAP